MRHAKSDWGNEALSDFDRPLNKRGNKDAPRMGQFLLKNQFTPDIIIASPALRAQQTAKHVSATCLYQGDIETFDMLYPGDSLSLLSKIEKINNKVDIAMIVGHNPIMEKFVSNLVSYHGDLGIQMTTAAMVGISIDTVDWKEISNTFKNLSFFVNPKLIKTIM